MYVSPMAVPFQTPVAIVPKVVILVEPVHVERAVFSTLFKLKSLFSSANVRPLTSLVPIKSTSSVVKASSDLRALPLSLPNVNVACFASRADCKPLVLAIVKSALAIDSLLYTIPAEALILSLSMLVMLLPVPSASMVLFVSVSLELAVIPLENADPF